jgi:hypothetical protein
MRAEPALWVAFGVFSCASARPAPRSAVTGGRSVTAPAQSQAEAMDCDPVELIAAVDADPRPRCLPVVHPCYGSIGACARGVPEPGSSYRVVIPADAGVGGPSAVTARLGRLCVQGKCSDVFVTDEVEPFLSGGGDLPRCGTEPACAASW